MFVVICVGCFQGPLEGSIVAPGVGGYRGICDGSKGVLSWPQCGWHGVLWDFPLCRLAAFVCLFLVIVAAFASSLALLLALLSYWLSLPNVSSFIAIIVVIFYCHGSHSCWHCYCYCHFLFLLVIIPCPFGCACGLRLLMEMSGGFCRAPWEL